MKKCIVRCGILFATATLLGCTTVSVEKADGTKIRYYQMFQEKSLYIKETDGSQLDYTTSPKGQEALVNGVIKAYELGKVGAAL